MSTEALDELKSLCITAYEAICENPISLEIFAIHYYEALKDSDEDSLALVELLQRRELTHNSSNATIALLNWASLYSATSRQLGDFLDVPKPNSILQEVSCSNPLKNLH